MRRPLLFCILLLSGCVSHEARVTSTADVAGSEGATVIGGTSYSAPPALTVDRSPLPRQLPVSAWRRDETGAIARYETEVTTPLPWWQRFPCDLVADLVPVDLTVVAEAHIAVVPITPRTRDDLDREAAAAGYATILQP